MKKIVLASNNKGKVREINQLLAGLALEVVPQSAFGTLDVEETGQTFVENAILKARHASHHTGLPAIADDSGLEVDILQGAPGIYSARYAGAGASDSDNVDKLLHALAHVADGERSARFQCLMVYMRYPTDPTPIICQGTWEGRILTEARGENGFGYDPIFWVPEENRSAAELDPQTKNRLSHRGQALKMLLDAIGRTVQP